MRVSSNITWVFEIVCPYLIRNCPFIESPRGKSCLTNGVLTRVHISKQMYAYREFPRMVTRIEEKLQEDLGALSTSIGVSGVSPEIPLMYPCDVEILFLTIFQLSQPWIQHHWKMFFCHNPNTLLFDILIIGATFYMCPHSNANMTLIMWLLNVWWPHRV